MTDADNADNLALLTNTPAQAESLLHSLEQAVIDIGLYVEANKTEYMCFKQKGVISTQRGKPLEWLSLYTLAAISHLLKVMSTYA